MNILLLGGTGNISAACAACWQAAGHTLTILTRGKSPVAGDYRVLHADRKDAGSMRAALGDWRPDAVVNFIGYDLEDARLDRELFRGATGQYVFISSTTVYARPAAALPLREDAPLGNAHWEYARRKIQCEQWLREQWEKEKFPVTIVRPSHTYSRRWIPNPISSSSYTFAARLEAGKPVYVPDDGENRWTLTAARDFALGLLGLLGHADALGEAFHITSDEVLTWNQIYAEIAGALGVKNPNIVQIPVEFICSVAPQMTGTLKGDKAHPGVFDNGKIKRFVPGFECRTTFREGIRESVAWLREHPDQRRIDGELDRVVDRILEGWRGRRSGSG